MLAQVVLANEAVGVPEVRGGKMGRGIFFFEQNGQFCLILLKK
jgi:hypothetical protein